MGALVLLCEMEVPILVEVAAGAQRSQAKHGFRSRFRPSRASPSHPVLDEVATCAFDDACRDRETVGKCAVVTQQPGVLHEVRGGLLDGLCGCSVESVRLDHEAHALRDVATTATSEQLHELVLDPALCVGCA